MCILNRFILLLDNVLSDLLCTSHTVKNRLLVVVKKWQTVFTAESVIAANTTPGHEIATLLFMSAVWVAVVKGFFAANGLSREELQTLLTQV